jgi:hypothetical protein
MTELTNGSGEDALPQKVGYGEQRAASASSKHNSIVPPEFFMAEYGHIVESFLRNEEDGEKRVAFLITLTSAVLGATGFLVHRSDGGLDVRAIIQARWFIGPTLLIPLAIGWFTLMRIRTRNLTADEYKLALRTLRRRFVTYGAARELENVFFKPYESYTTRSFSLVPFAKAGWLEVVALVNALLTGMFAAVLLSPVLANGSGSKRGWALAATAAVIALTWSGQILLAEGAYKRKIQGAVQCDEADRLMLRAIGASDPTEGAPATGRALA